MANDLETTMEIEEPTILPGFGLPLEENRSGKVFPMALDKYGYWYV